MDLVIGSKVGEGGFSDVYEATDKLGRKVAVKIMRASAAMLSSALEHAQALVRAQHPNVVSVIALEKVPHPETGELVDAIVMEHLSGEPLAVKLRHHQFTSVEVAGIGRGLVAGLRHIHFQGLAHGDLHAENVIVINDVAKIIDILYRDSLALLSNASKETLIRRDLLNLRLLLYDILLTSELDPSYAADFSEMLGATYSIDEIDHSLEQVLDPARGQDQEVFIERALERIRDEDYVEGDDYAEALGNETPDEITKPLLLRLIASGGVLRKHRPYIRLLWVRLTESAKRDVASELSKKLDKEVPRGRWSSPINILEGCGREGWDALPERTRLRLEAAIVNDILVGQHDIYNTKPGGPGTLGTYTNLFWRYFKNRDKLLDNIVAKLTTNWNGQNYVGKYFTYILVQISDTPERKRRSIEALQYAVRNDSKIIVEKLGEFPKDWQAKIKSK